MKQTKNIASYGIDALVNESMRLAHRELIMERRTNSMTADESDNKEIYRRLCEYEKSISLFSQDWWLDAVADNCDWDVVLIKRNGCVVASLPFFRRRRFGLSLITMPPMTPHLGPWIKPTTSNYTKQLDREKKLLIELFAKLPKFHHLEQCWSPEQTNWLPLYWKGFSQKTLYTYRLVNINETQQLWANFQTKVRTDIRKAVERYGIIVNKSASLEEFWKINCKVFERQNLAMPYTYEFLRKLDGACSSRECRAILTAIDPEGRVHAGAYIVWDANTAYYLMGGGDPSLRSSGATSLCIWEAIKLTSKKAGIFDFEGSMIEPVERFFRGFGSCQTPYFMIGKTKFKPLKIWKTLRNEFL